MTQTKSPLSERIICCKWQLASAEHCGLASSIIFFTSLTRSSSFLMSSGI